MEINTPILIKKGDSRVLLNGVAPKVDCRVVAEEYYQTQEKKIIELQNKIKYYKDLLDEIDPDGEGRAYFASELNN